MAGQLINASSSNFEYKVNRLNISDESFNSTVINWTTHSTQFGGLFRIPLSSLSGGWYSIEISANFSGGQQTASIKFGVGEVFLIAGQSNAQGVNSVSLYSTVAYDGGSY